METILLERDNTIPEQAVCELFSIQSESIQQRDGTLLRLVSRVDLNYIELVEIVSDNLYNVVNA